MTSPTAFNNSIVKPQSKSNLTYILRGIDLSLISYADDVLNLSRLLHGLEENFIQFQVEYGKIGLQFNEKKSDVLLFNAKQGSAVDVRLGGATVRLAEHIVYLGIPIGRSMLETRHLLQSHLQKRISLAYSRVVVYKRQFDRRILAHLYNAMALPHYLYLSPFWRIFQKEDKKELRSTYYKYAKYLLRLPPWTSNRIVTSRYGIIDPNEAILAQIARYNSNIVTHPWAIILRQ